MKIKILLSSNPFYLATASANRWLTLIEGLSALGVSIELLIYGNFNSKAELENFASSGNYNGINIKYIRSSLVIGIWQRRFYKYIGKYLQLAKTKKIIKKEVFNFSGIVWSENDIAIWKILSSIPNRSFKLVAEMSEFLDIHHFNKGTVLNRKLGDSTQLFFEKNYFQQLDGFILMTKTLLNHYEHFPNRKPKMLHLPMTVDLDRFSKEYDLPNGFEKPYIAFIGVMNDAKDGVNILIEAFAKIHQKFPKYNLYLIGGWNYDTPNHQKLIKKYDLQDKVFWKGEFSREEIPSILNGASLLALPRPDSKQAQGGFPTKLGEYLASGTPVCATTVGELPLYLKDGDSVFFAEPGDTRSLIEALLKALKNPELAVKVGAQGKKVAQIYFNKEIQTKLLYDFLKQL
jgi:glycosyltransferase involved in cell wall biosynthesis